MSKRIRSKLSGKQAAQWERADRLVREGNTAEALPLLEKLASKAGYADAWVMLGVIAQRQRDAPKAEHCYRQALLLRPDYPEVHSNIGQLLLERNATAEATEHFATTLKTRPDFAPAHLGLGRIYLSAGRLDVAERHLEQALRQQDDPATIGLLGIAKTRLGKTEEAEDLFRQLLRSGRDSYNANLNLGHLLLKNGRDEEALEHYRRAEDIGRLQVEPLIGKAKALAILRRFDEADATLALARKRDSKSVDNLNFRQYPGAARPLDEIPLLQSGTTLFFAQWKERLVHCDWTDYEANLAATRRLIEQTTASGRDIGLNPFQSLLLPLGPQTQLDIAQRRGRYIAEQVTPLPAPEVANLRNNSDRLRIGYISPDFRRHAVTQMYLELLTGHDPEHFEVFGYSLWPQIECPVQRAIKASCDHFVYLDRSSNREAAERIQSDGIQVLIDLAGYVQYSRPEILAHRPAPVQAIYGGYPGTCGAPWIDYKCIGKPYLDPGDEAYYSEKLAVIHDTHQVVSELPKPATQRSQKTDWGLPADAFVFCSFQGAKKYEPELFACWMRILGRVHGSVLWLMGNDEQVRENLRRHAREAGIEPHRLVFADIVDMSDHIQRQSAADLFLDTWTYGGITTVSAALWAGLPVLTWTGNNYTSRQGRAAMACFGLLEQTVAKDLLDYEEKAVHLACNPQALATLRDHIASRRNNSPLFENHTTIRRIERAYGIMWQKYLDGESPSGFEVD